MVEPPFTDAKEAALESFDNVWGGLIDRLEGLEDDEYLWAPLDGWTVAETGSGAVQVTGAGHREIGPFTTIAWRMWHIAVDCLDGYSANLFGSTGCEVSGRDWYMTPEPAVAELHRAWIHWRAGLAALDGAQWSAPLGEAWGPFARHNVHDLALHAHHEVAHHAGEIGVLRDLWRGGVR